MPDSADWIETALAYASQGYRVVPFHQTEEGGVCSCGNKHCERPGDHPRFCRFTQEASRDEDRIRPWGDLWADSSIGAVTGYTSNLVVLEVDRSRGGIESYNALDVCPPATCTAEHVRGLFRMFFRHPDAELPPKLEIAPGLVLRGDGTAVRLPDATHYVPRHKYKWKANRPLDPAALPRMFWDRVGVDLHPDWPPAEEGPTVSLPFRRHEKEKLARLSQPAWAVYPWAAKGSLTLFVGGRGSGTSPLMAGFGASVLQGRRFAGERCRQSGVVYLSEQAPAIFARRLLRQDPDRRALRQLSTLFAHDLRPKAWGELLRGCVERAAQDGAEVLIIDSLDTFAALAEPPCSLDSAALVEPIYAALAQDLAVVCTATLKTGGGTSFAEAVPSLGPLGAAADVITSVSKRGDGQRALLRSLSKFDATPEKRVVHLDARGCKPVHTPGPLFQNHRARARKTSAAGPSSSQGGAEVPFEAHGDGDLRKVATVLS